VKKGLTELLNADAAYQHFITKNPLCNQFNSISMHDKKWELLELLDWIPDELLGISPTPNLNKSSGRNCAIFESSRRFAYSVLSNYKDKMHRDEFDTAVLKFSNQANEKLIERLGANEIRSIAKSVSKWCWNNYDPKNSPKTGILTFEQRSLTGKERQSIGAQHTNHEKREKTLARLQKSIKGLKASNIHPTQNLVAKRSALSLRTVKRYWNSLVD